MTFLSNINHQLKKFRIQSSLEYRVYIANGRKRMIDAECSRALGQFIRRNNEVR